jgi:D-serine deaminase-like pyridoxal phosphate-dependent protein
MSLGPNRFLIGKDRNIFERELATPALLVDLGLLEQNIRAMAEIGAAHGRALRPHAKAHKSAIIGRMQFAAGAVGLCCATVLEAEVLAAAGLEGLLVTSPVITPAMVNRLFAAADMTSGLMVVVDSERGVELLAEAARPSRPVDVLVDIDMGLRRTGLVHSAEVVHLARSIAERPHLRYRGLQAYYGHLQHVPKLTDRLAKVAEQWEHLAGITSSLATAGLAPEIISGGGTGTHNLDLEQGPFTEIQPGSYIFMDKQYGEVEIAPVGSPFETALTVAARVISVAQPHRVIVDAGSKALSTDAGPAPIASGAPAGSTYAFMGDEHGAIDTPSDEEKPVLGGLVTLVAPHCDPTVNLYDHFHVIKDGVLRDIWPIEARGH